MVSDTTRVAQRVPARTGLWVFEWQWQNYSAQDTGCIAGHRTQTRANQKAAVPVFTLWRPHEHHPVYPADVARGLTNTAAYRMGPTHEQGG